MFTHVDIPNIPKIKSHTAANGVRHYETPEGNKYPSATTILGGTHPKEKAKKLNDWRNSLGTQKADKETKRCADRGTAVHSLIERYLNNEEKFTKGVNQEFVRSFNQIKMRLNHIDNIRAQEVKIWSDILELAGTVDCVAEYDGVLSIVDFKTSNNTKDNKMVEDYYLQCTAYAIMWHELTGESIENIVIIMTVEKGMAPLVFKDKIDKYVEPLLNRIKEYKVKQQCQK